MPYAIILKNPRTPYYDIVIHSNDVDDIGLLRGYAAYYSPYSLKYKWSDEEYYKNGEAWVTEESMIVSDIEKVNKFKNKGVVLSINVYSVYERLVVLGTVEYGIKYFSKYAFANHHSLYRLSLIEREKFLDRIEMMKPEQLLLHYMAIINRRKRLLIETEEPDMFCLSPLSSPKFSG